MVASGLGTIEFSTTGCIKKHLLLLFIAFFLLLRGLVSSKLVIFVPGDFLASSGWA